MRKPFDSHRVLVCELLLAYCPGICLRASPKALLQISSKRILVCLFTLTPEVHRGTFVSSSVGNGVIGRVLASLMPWKVTTGLDMNMAVSGRG